MNLVAIEAYFIFYNYFAICPTFSFPNESHDEKYGSVSKLYLFCANRPIFLEFRILF